ncbi:MAG: hypothetical protein LUE11_12100 [Clostridia bacterium]|nr:hypothetical protein [Clostridia bacterium]
MKNCPLCQKAGQYRAIAASKFGDAREYAAAGYSIAQSHIAALLGRFVLSEVFVLKMMLISLGVLIGTMFSDFFKKHRAIVIVAFLASVALFVYKTFQLISDLEDSAEDF